MYVWTAPVDLHCKRLQAQQPHLQCCNRLISELHAKSGVVQARCFTGAEIWCISCCLTYESNCNIAHMHICRNYPHPPSALKQYADLTAAVSWQHICHGLDAALNMTTEQRAEKGRLVRQAFLQERFAFYARLNMVKDELYRCVTQFAIHTESMMYNLTPNPLSTEMRTLIQVCCGQSLHASGIVRSQSYCDICMQHVHKHPVQKNSHG